MEYMIFNGKQYAFDLERCIQFITNIEMDDCTSEQTISQTYGATDKGKLMMIGKDVNESKSNTNETLLHLRHDLLNTMLSMVLVPTTDMSGTVINSSMEHWTFGQRVAFNTLIKEEILIEL